MTSLNRKQVNQLLAPINPKRVMKDDGKGHAHIAQQEVTAHLIRVLGFGGFDTDIREAVCIFEHNRPTSDGKPSARWDVGYRALVRLTIKDADGNEIAHYEDGATATAENQKLGEAHSLAYKSALSLAKKRAAVNLGDQFGLSLYNKGQRSALVIDTLIKPADNDRAAKPKDLQEGVPEQVAEDQDEPAAFDPDDAPKGLGAALKESA